MSLDDIRARADAKPCINYHDHACARADRVRLLAALDAITKLHYQREDAEDVIPWSCMDGPCEHDDDCPEVEVKGCDECSTPEYIVQWPCPTVRAITEALG